MAKAQGAAESVAAAFRLHCLSAPPGASSACAAGNAVVAWDAAVLTRLACAVMEQLRTHRGSTEAAREIAELVERVRDSNVAAGTGGGGGGGAGSAASVANLLRGLEYYARGRGSIAASASAMVSEQEATETLASTTAFSAEAIAAVVQGWAQSDARQQEQSVEQQPGNSKALHIGQLISVNWKLGVAMASSKCDSLLTPYVSLVFRSSDVNGRVSTHALELSYAEFQNLHGTLQTVAGKLERV